MADVNVSSQRHNVLLLTVDTWRADRMSVYGYDRPTTPALEKFARSAIVCDNAYTIGPFTQIACVPLFTSSRPLSYGGYDAGAVGRPNTIFKHLKQAGYSTWGLCTMHWISSFFGYLDGFDEATEIFLLNAIPGIASNGMRDALYAWRRKEISDSEAVEKVTPVIRYTFRNIVNYCDSTEARWDYISANFPDCKVVNDKYKFDQVKMIVERHRREFEHDPTAYLKTHLPAIPQPHEWIVREWRYKRKASALIGSAADRLLGLVSPRLGRLRSNRFGMSPDAHSIADAVVSALATHQDSQPFMIWAHFKDTHQPFVSGRGRNWFRQTPDYLKALGYDPRTDPGAVFKGWPQSAEDWKVVSSLYDCAMRSTDEAIGRILDAVEELGLDGGTVIGMSGDHGEEIGEHGDYGHTVSAYEHTSRIPFMLRGPGVAGRRIGGFTSSLDFAPTVAALAGVDPDPDWEGLAVHSPQVAERRHVLTEALCRGSCDFDNRPPYLAIRDERYKYLWREYRDPFHIHGPDSNELYDLIVDPLEQNNIYRPDHSAVSAFNPVIADRLAEIPEISDRRIVDAFGEIGAAAVRRKRPA